MNANRAKVPPRPGLGAWLRFLVILGLGIGFSVGLGRYRMHLQQPVPGQQVAPGGVVMIQELRIIHKSLSTASRIPDELGTTSPADPGSTWVVLSLRLEYGADGYNYESFPCRFELHTAQAMYSPSTETALAPDGGTGCYGDRITGDKTVAAGTKYDLNVWWQVPTEVSEQPMTAWIIAGKPLKAVEFTR